MLALTVVQILAGVSLAMIVGGFSLGHWLSPPSQGAVRVVARKGSTRWTEVVWVGGALIASFWSIGVLLVPGYAYDRPAVPDFPDSGGIQLLGFLVLVAGGLLFFASVRALGPHMTPEIRVQEGHRLVQAGPYRFIRHPAYTAIVTGGVGGSILYLSLPLGLVTILLVAMAVYRARLEEELLGSPEAFGSAYADYITRTGRFLPRIRSKP